LGDQRAKVAIGSSVRAVFEHHDQYCLVHWQVC
jgi:hypothetical protein